jgi:sterol desaturase/sphingolipid hydroxylase (fatty acid hydroxylase superfamily)
MIVLHLTLAVLAGALTWTLLEYWIHRSLGHNKRFKKNPFAVEHIRHHIEGNYFAPTWKKLLAAVLAAAIASVPAIWALGTTVGPAYVAGLIGFYLVYELMHRLEHVFPGLGPYGRWARRHHFTHHFTDARYNHGVTTPIWDFVFGTYKKPGTIVVPKKLCMEWLKDPETGAVRADWADTYVLQGSATR